MKKLCYFFLLIFVFAWAYVWLMRDFPQQESTLIFNGNILTMEKDLNVTEAIYVEDGKIKALGSYGELKTYTNSKTEILDLEGKTSR